MRLRIRFTKLGKIRWTSHRDIARVWERVIRLSRLPIAYSQGFSPHPKMHFGLALSTGHESMAEYIDITLDPDAPGLPTPQDLELLPERLTGFLPGGLEVTAVAEIASNATSLQQAVVACDWSIELRDAQPDEVASAIERLMASPELMVTRQRKGKDVTDDVRPYLLHLAVVGKSEHGTEIEAHLATQPRGLRITELISLLGADWVEGRVRRTTQWMLLDGARCEPLVGPTGATAAPHAEARAS